MYTNKIQDLINGADQLLDTAHSEMNRSEEDVVTHLVCHTSRKALSIYMKAFLLKNNIETNDHISLDELLTKCQEFDPLFNQVDMSNIHCRFDHHEEEFCLSVGQVDYCMDVASKVRTILDKK